MARFGSECVCSANKIAGRLFRTNELGVGFDYKTNWLEIFAQHRTVGPNFNPEVGFLERNDCLCNYVDATLKARPRLPGVREVQFEGFLFHAPDTKHVL